MTIGCSSLKSGKSFNSVASGATSLTSKFNFKSSRKMWKSMKSDNSLLGGINNLGKHYIHYNTVVVTI